MRAFAPIVALALLLGMAAPDADAGRRWRFTPSLASQAEYNDDVQYLGKGDVETRFDGELKLEVDSERTEHTLRAGASRYKYADLDRLDRTETELSLETEHRATERLTLRANVSTGSDYTLTTAEEEFGTTAEKVRRDTLALSGRAEYLLTERTLVGLGYNYGSTQYSGTYVDTAGHGVSADVAHMATERLTLLGAVSRSFYDSEFQDGGSGDYTATSITGGLRYALSEIWTAQVTAGKQFSSNVLKTGSIDEVVRETGDLLSAALEWKYERSRGQLIYNRDTTTGLSGSTLTRDRLRFLHHYDTTERSRLTLRAGLTESESQGVLSTNENRYWDAGVRWRYRTTEHSSFWVGYDRQETENLITDRKKDRNKFFLRFEMAIPQEWTLGSD